MAELLTVTLNGYPLTGFDTFGAWWHTDDPIDGWDGTSGSTLTLTQRPRAAGAFVGQSPQMTARDLAITGVVEATDRDSLTAALDRLNSAASVNPSRVPLIVTMGSVTRNVRVYRSDAVLIQSFSNGTAAAWSIQLVAPDPRKLGTAVSGSTGLPSVSGGLTIPFTVPFVLASTVTAGSIALTNTGTVAGPLSARIDGPVVAPFIQQSTPAGVTRVLSFPNLTLVAGEWLAIGDVDTQTVLANGTATRDRYIGSRDWPSFPPGTNTYGFGATSGGGRLTVTGTPAW